MNQRVSYNYHMQRKRHALYNLPIIIIIRQGFCYRIDTLIYNCENGIQIG